MKDTRSTVCVWGGVMSIVMALILVFAGCADTTSGGDGKSDITTGDKGDEGNGPNKGDTLIESDVPSNTKKITGPDVKDYVNTKYANLSTEVRDSQDKWNMGNSHDPKLFLDDDGTYYVYSTDASCGNIEYTGINIRYSKDLVNWTTLSKSAIQGYWDEDFLAWQGMSASSSEKKHKDSYTAVTWAPTVIKQNGLYYMYHGVSTDVTMGGKTFATSSIVLAIASNPKGPFYPASCISQGKITTDDANAIKAKLGELQVEYKQNFLVRYCPYDYSAKGSKKYDSYSSSSNGAALDGEPIKVPDYSQCNNTRYGSIDPEFVYDVATGKLREYTIGSNACYAITYGSWMNGIVVAYVDTTSLKPVALGNFSVDGKSYSKGDELDFSLDHAACTGSVTDCETGHANTSSTDRFLLLGVPIIGGSSSSPAPNNGAATAYEGAQLFYNSKSSHYYIITSCGALMWEYRCGVGRSTDIYGPYLDAGGVDMWLGTSNYSKYHAIGSKIIGSHVLKDEFSMRSQGGLSVLRGADGNVYFANHTRTNYLEEYHFALQIHQMFFNADDWPVLNQNEYYSDYKGLTDDGKESLTKLTVADVAGTYDTILTVRGTETAAVSSLDICGASEESAKVNKQDAVPTASKGMVLESDGSISGNYTGTWTLANDGQNITIALKDANGSALGTFKGIVMYAVDWTRKTNDERFTITFSTLCSESNAKEAGEFFWGNRQAVPLWSVSGNTYTYNGKSTSSVTVPKIAVTDSEGFTVQFKATLPVWKDGDDWGAKILSYKGCHVTIPNLDPWNNDISGSKLTDKNSYPTAQGASLGSGLAFNSAFGGTHTIKIVFKNNTITFYLDGKTWVTYSSSALSNGMQEFVGYYITGLNAGEVTFNEAGMNITDVTITKGAN